MLEKLAKFRLRPGVKLVHPDGTDQFFLYRDNTGERYELNEVSYEMICQMRDGMDESAICAAIANDFESAENVRADLDTLLSALVAEGVIERHQ